MVAAVEGNCAPSMTSALFGIEHRLFAKMWHTITFSQTFENR